MSESGQGFRLFSRTPLYVQILIALVLAVGSVSKMLLKRLDT